MSALVTIGVAIPAYRNVAMLRRCLTSVAEVSPALLERTTVVDDSGDGRNASELRADFPSVTWIAHDGNKGFGPSATEAVLHCDADAVVLLNDDVALLSDPSPMLEELFSDAGVFAVTFRSQRADGAFREGAKRLVWRLGFPKILHNERDQQAAHDGRRLSSYAVGGHAAFRRTMFRDLGGFDRLFDPFYWEDVDLCARARGRGWLTLYCEECRVLHDEGGAIRSHFERAHIREITLRNRLLFAWRHAPSPLRPMLWLSLAMRSAAAFVARDTLL